MLQVLGCFVEAHDHRLVGLAALICGLASITAVQLLCHAQRAAGRLQLLWLAVASAAAGSGIWATHFIAMLAYMPGVASGYDVRVTVVSLISAVLITAVGLGVAVLSRRPLAAWTGGAILGGGIAVMHCTGMAALVVAGHMVWTFSIVLSSIALGTVLGAAALPVALGPRSFRRQFGGAGLLVLAICIHHFTAMGAVTIVADPTIAVPASSLPTSALASGVAFASFAILLLAGAALALDMRDRRHSAIEGERLRSLANAAVEGILVCCGSEIVSANESFARLVGRTEAAVRHEPVSRFLPDEPMRFALKTAHDEPIEADLIHTDGSQIPVELIVRTVAYGSRPHYAVAVRDLRARRKAERQIDFLANHDGLTGLANRAALDQHLDREIETARATGGRLALLCLDLDRFKEVNDLFGHAEGDTLLQDVARSVTGALDESQMMARLGGDQFAVVTRIDGEGMAGRLAFQLLDALPKQDPARSGPTVGGSIGIAIYPDDAVNRTALLACADTALHRAKREGRGTHRFYDNRMGRELRERRLIEHDLRHAIARGELEVVYQPQMRVRTGEVAGFEALMRWKHPTRGYVSPALFIPIAEETGLILDLGEWILWSACREAASWHVPLSVAVNVSAVQLLAPRFSALLRETLAETGLAPERLEIEITETAIVGDPARALQTLRQCKALGVRIAMDDFGTGYSSLSNLRLFPFDRIKIDGSFVRSVDSNGQAAAIIRSVLGLGRGLGLPVLAEGVETLRELEFLRGEDCSEAQGYFLGRPAPIETFAATVRPTVRETRRPALVA